MRTCAPSRVKLESFSKPFLVYSEIFGILTGYHHQQNDLHDVKFMHKTFTKTIEKYLHDKQDKVYNGPRDILFNEN